MEIRINKYGVNDTYTVRSKTENIHNIVDKMIYLTAKLTEEYASDIYYDIQNLMEAVENKKEMDVLLFFREYGVTTRQMEKFNGNQYDPIYYDFNQIQTWRLTHDPNTTETILERVAITANYF